jgi:hypothetical protein
MARAIALATLVAGTIDILYAALLSAIYGRGPAAMLRYVASGPLPSAKDMGAAGSALGLIVHFTLMAIMAAVYVLAARDRPSMITRPLQWGVLYGLVTYVVMNLIVVPLRFGTPMPPTPLSIAFQLFAHVVLVGIPIAKITTRSLRTTQFA